MTLTPLTETGRKTQCRLYLRNLCRALWWHGVNTTHEMMRLVTFSSSWKQKYGLTADFRNTFLSKKRPKLFMYRLSESLHSMDPCVQLCLVLRVEAASVWWQFEIEWIVQRFFWDRATTRLTTIARPAVDALKTHSKSRRFGTGRKKRGRCCHSTRFIWSNG